MVTTDDGTTMQPDVQAIIVAYLVGDRRETFRVPKQGEPPERPGRDVSAFEFKPDSGLAVERYDGSTVFIPVGAIRWVKFEKRQEGTDG